MPTPDVQRLAELVRQRRIALDLTQTDVAARGGPSDTTLGKVESAVGTPNRQTLMKLDVGLGWTPGSARRVLDGGEPTPAEGDPPAIEPRDSRTAPRLLSRVDPEAGKARTFEELFQRWAELYNESLLIELEYGRRRGLPQPAHARQELMQALLTAQQGADGRPWTPPWEVDVTFPSGVTVEVKSTHTDTDRRGRPRYLAEVGEAARQGEPVEPSDQDDDVTP